MSERVPVDFNNIEDDGRIVLGPQQRLIGVDGDEEVEIVAVFPDWHTQRPSPAMERWVWFGPGDERRCTCGGTTYPAIHADDCPATQPAPNWGHTEITDQ